MKEKKNGKKEVVGKGYEGKEEIKKLMADTMKKLSSIAGDIEKCPRKKYCGWKLGSRLLVTVGPRNLSFMMWVYEYNKTGNRTSIEDFEIKSTSKDVSVIIAGLVKQVKKNYAILKEASSKKTEVVKAEEKEK